MNQNDLTHVAESLQGLSDFLRGKPLKPDHVRRYWESLRHLPQEQFDRAVQVAQTRCKFMPKPVELLEFIGGVTEDSEREQAWLWLQEAIRLCGQFDYFAITDPALALTIKSMGGMTSITRRNSDDLATFGYRQFCSSYDALRGSRGGPYLFVTPKGSTNAEMFRLKYKQPACRVIGREITPDERKLLQNKRAMAIAIGDKPRITSAGKILEGLI